jgi:hypothetical protein
MLSNKPGMPSALIEDLTNTDFRNSRSRRADDTSAHGAGRVFSAFDDFLDRMPAWIFHGLGSIAGLGALWFALAYLGGLPRGIVEWITLAMIGAFAYAVGFMIPLVVTYLIESRSRALAVLLVIGGGAVFGALSLPASF